MLRREFIVSSLLAFPAISFPFSIKNENAFSGAFVVRNGVSRFGIPTPFKGVNPNDLKLSSKDTKGLLSAFEYTGIQKTGPSYHSHPDQDEIFFVSNGEFIFQLGKEKTRLKKGDLIFLPRNIPHTWLLTSERGQLFYFLQPAGKMEEFFLLMTQSGGKLSKEEREKVGREHGIVNHGPGLSADDRHELIENLSNGFIIRATESRYNEKTILNGLNPNDLKVSGKDTEDKLSIFEYVGNEKGGPPLHFHYFQDEIFYITEGSYLFQCGDEKFTLAPGDMIFLPKKVPHTWAQLTDKGRMVYFFQPAGKMEEFFRTIGQKAPLPEKYDAFKAHDMEITGPPLAF